MLVTHCCVNRAMLDTLAHFRVFCGCVNRLYGRSWVAELALSRSTIVDRDASRVDADGARDLRGFSSFNVTLK